MSEVAPQQERASLAAGTPNPSGGGYVVVEQNSSGGSGPPSFMDGRDVLPRRGPDGGTSPAALVPSPKRLNGVGSWLDAFYG